MKTHEDYMLEAIKEAKKALKNNEVPVGAVIVKDGEIIARGYNKKELKKDSTCHAEIEVIRKASKKLGDWRLSECDMYITLEPCIMCSGAIVSARIQNVYFGASDTSSNISGETILNNSFMNHKTNYYSGIRKQECENILKEFFTSKRR